MKALIVDVDGVLNQCPNGGLCGIRLGLLNKIIKETGCFIIISSTWRNHREQYERLLQELLKMGIHDVDITPTINGENKIVEINMYLEDTKKDFRNIVILDDDVSQDQTHHRVVQTDSYKGLTPFLATCVINLLNH